MLLNRPCYITGLGVGGDVEVTYLVVVLHQGEVNVT